MRCPGESMLLLSKGNQNMIDDLMENAGGEAAFMDEKQLLAKLPISR